MPGRGGSLVGQGSPRLVQRMLLRNSVRFLLNSEVWLVMPCVSGP